MVLHSRVALGLNHKHLTRLERPAKDKHSSLLQTVINWVCKSFIKFCQGLNVMKLFDRNL